jgi:hypothetical protein
MIRINVKKEKLPESKESPPSNGQGLERNDQNKREERKAPPESKESLRSL